MGDKLKYVYHIVYFYRKGLETGYGAATLYRENKLDSENEITLAEKIICEKKDLEKIVILNFILLNTKGK